MSNHISLLSAEDRQVLAARLFPDAASLSTPEDLEKKYPERQLSAEAKVTRVAPSPTGFAHIGMVFVSLVNRRLAKQTGGVFILRIEDTDAKREVAGATDTIIATLSHFGLPPDEGFVNGSDSKTQELGEYGPYLQSSRRDIYRGLARWLIEQGKAYPCFISEDELAKIYNQQTGQKLRPGIYGRWATWRDRSLKDIMTELDKGSQFVIRLRAWGEPAKRLVWNDGIKGKISMPENDLDVVILKSDGQSLYHFAHIVDDHFMRITDVIRGDEWLSSVPLHCQIFQAFGWKIPQYAHLSTIQKLEILQEADEETGEMVERKSKRKLSKRKDPEANAQYYYQMGFPPEAVIEYLLNLANSDFEDWRKANPFEPHESFELKLNRFSTAGALTDTAKLLNISRDVISRMDINSLFDKALTWAELFDTDLAAIMKRDPDYTRRCLNIERDAKKPSKRIASWQDLRPQLTWLFDETFADSSTFEFPEHISEADRNAVLSAYMESYDPSDDRDQWFSKCKEVAKKLGFAAETKEFKANPLAFKGSIGDVTMLIRVAITGSRQSPDLYEVLQVLGQEKVSRRLRRFQK